MRIQIDVTYTINISSQNSHVTCITFYSICSKYKNKFVHFSRIWMHVDRNVSVANAFEAILLPFSGEKKGETLWLSSVVSSGILSARLHTFRILVLLVSTRLGHFSLDTVENTADSSMGEHNFWELFKIQVPSWDDRLPFHLHRERKVSKFY